MSVSGIREQASYCANSIQTAFKNTKTYIKKNRNDITMIAMFVLGGGVAGFLAGLPTSEVFLMGISSAVLGAGALFGATVIIGAFAGHALAEKTKNRGLKFLAYAVCSVVLPIIITASFLAITGTPVGMALGMTCFLGFVGVSVSAMTAACMQRKE